MREVRREALVSAVGTGYSAVEGRARTWKVTLLELTPLLAVTTIVCRPEAYVEGTHGAVNSGRAARAPRCSGAVREGPGHGRSPSRFVS